jgi:hypothetical protein
LQRLGSFAVMVLYATEAIAGLVGRILSGRWESGDEKRDPAVARFGHLLAVARRANDREASVFVGCAEEEARRENRPVVPNEVLVDEIVRLVECPVGVARGLLSWTLEVASLRPYLFRDLVALESDGLIALRPSRRKAPLRLAELWGRTELLREDREEAVERAPVPTSGAVSPP